MTEKEIEKHSWTVAIVSVTAIILTMGYTLKSCYLETDPLPPGDYVALTKSNLPIILDRVSQYYGAVTGIVFQCDTGTNVTLNWRLRKK